MAYTPIYKYVWLVEVIRKAGEITFEEINSLWLENKELSDGVQLSKRTFHKWRTAAEELFGIIIDCRRKGGYHFFIANDDDLKTRNFKNWLMDSISASNLLMQNQSMRDRILLEPVPSGDCFLDPILRAMKDNSTIIIDYRKFESDTPFDLGVLHTVEPYALKIFKRRWYLLGRPVSLIENPDIPPTDKLYVFALDRINDIEIRPERKFKLPDGFDAEAYFADSFGVLVDDDYDACKVVVKVSEKQAPYFRTLPIHSSQQETEPCVFEYWLRPTFDFEQEILSHIPDIEVLSPAWFREEILYKIKTAHENAQTSGD